MAEAAILHNPTFVEFSKKRRQRRGVDKDTWQGKPSPSESPRGPSRKQLLVGLCGTAAVAGLSLFLGNKLSQPQEVATPANSAPYRNWERYRNSVLPSETVIAIGNDIAQATAYSGFAEVGRIIVNTQKNPEKLKEIFPSFKPPINLFFTDSVEKSGALATLTLNADGVTVAANVRNKQTGQEQKGIFAQINKIALGVEMDNTSYAAPDLAKILLLVKEFSHFAYYQRHKEVLLKQVAENFEILEPANMSPDEIYENAIFQVGKGKNIPEMGDLFEHALIDVDGAGYWHTTPAFGKMKRLSHLNAQTIRILASNDWAFETAVGRGLLLEKGKGEFSWREGIGPFSTDWLNITRTFLDDKNP